MQYIITHQSQMQICRILPPQYVKDKIFGRTRRMCGRWRLCSFPRVVVFGRRRLLLPQPSPGGPRERFLVDSLRGGPLSASSQILRRLRFSGAPQPLSLSIHPLFLASTFWYAHYLVGSSDCASAQVRKFRGSLCPFLPCCHAATSPI